MYSTFVALLSATFILPATSNPIDKGGFMRLPRDAASYEAAVLYEHNTLRAQHSASALSWDSALASDAQVLASSCVYEHDTTIGSGGYGQNIAADGSISASPSDDQDTIVVNTILNDWYSEASGFAPYYGIQTPPLIAEPYFHFTQLVWKATTSVGCYSQFCPNFSGTGGLNAWYTVCNYSPAGNVLGQFASNVSPN